MIYAHAFAALDRTEPVLTISVRSEGGTARLLAERRLRAERKSRKR
jgi:hypothetical protein